MILDERSRKLPGSWLYQFTEKYFEQPGLEKIAQPIIADLQHEYISLPHVAIKRSLILLRGYWSFWKALGLYSLLNDEGNMRIFKTFGFTALLGAAVGAIVSLFSWNGNRTPGFVSTIPNYVTALVLFGLLFFAIWFSSRQLQRHSFVDIWKVAMRILVIASIVFGTAVAILCFVKYDNRYGDASLFSALGFLGSFMIVFIFGVAASALVRCVLTHSKSTRILSIVIFIALLLGFMSGISRAEGYAITFHLVCEQMSDECLSVPIVAESGQSILIRKEPLMAVSQDRVREVEWKGDTSGNAQIQISLTKEAGEQLGQITGDNIGQRLAIVEDGKALIAPRILAAITGGVFSIGGSADVYRQLQTISWLKKMAAEKVALNNTRRSAAITIYLWLGVLALAGGSVYFAFFRKRSAAE